MAQSKLDRYGTDSEKETVSSDAILRLRSPRRVPVSLETSGRVSHSKGKPKRNRSPNISPLDRRESATGQNGRTGGVGLRAGGNLSILHLPWKVGNTWNLFFHSRTTQVRDLIRLRMGFALLVLGSFGMLGLDYDRFFAPGPNNMIPLDEGRWTFDSDTKTIFSVVPQTRFVYWFIYWIFMTQTALFGLGVFPRIQALCMFVWICSFHHHNLSIWNSEDQVLRILCFLFVFFPPHTSVKSWPMWPIRLMQLEMCLIFISTGILKWQGEEWRSGQALWYVVHLNDFYGMFLNPSFVFGNHFMLQLLTYATLVLEIAVPILIWFKAARPLMLLTVLGFHLSLDLSMNLNFFHWVMILGWLSFIIQPTEEKKDNSTRYQQQSPNVKRV